MPAKYAPKKVQSSDLMVKVMSALCYLTAGLAGFIYIIANGRDNKAMFFRFHFLQALLTGMLCCFITWTGSTLLSTMGGIIGLFGPAALENSMSVLSILAFAIRILGYSFSILIIAGIVQSLRGKYLELPWISKIVRSNLR